MRQVKKERKIRINLKSLHLILYDIETCETKVLLYIIKVEECKDSEATTLILCEDAL